MASTQSQGQHQLQAHVKHVHHGRTVAAWVGTIATSVAFVIGGIGLVIGNWMIFWIAVAIVVLAIIATVVLKKMGYGAD